MAYPASQNFLVESNENRLRPGTMYACVTSVGSHGMFRLHVCVDMIVVPSGSVIVIGHGSQCLLMTGASATRK